MSINFFIGFGFFPFVSKYEDVLFNKNSLENCPFFFLCVQQYFQSLLLFLMNIYIYKSYLILFVLSNNYHLNYLWAFNVQPPAMAEHVLMYIVTFFSYLFLGFN